MRLVVDMQGAQTLSRLQGIGRYTRGLAQALVRHAGPHQVILACNGLLLEGAAELRRIFAGEDAAGTLRMWHGPAHSQFPAEASLDRKDAEAAYVAFLNSLAPDALLLPTLLGEWEDNFTCSLEGLRQDMVRAAVVHDFIPLEPFCPDLTYGDNLPIYEAKLRMMWQMDVLFANSAFTRAATLRQNPQAHVVAIGADVEPCFRPTPVLAAQEPQFNARFAPLRHGEGFILYAGGCAPHKNLAALVASYGCLAPELRQKYRLVIVGSASPEMDACLGAAGLGADDVVLTGWVSDAELVQLYSCCTLFVYPSLAEGFGLTVLEAMRCGAPVLASSAMSLTEIVAWDEALFDPADTDRLTRLMHAALTDTTFLAKLRANSQTREKFFSWDAAADEVWRRLEACQSNKPVAE